MSDSIKNGKFKSDSLYDEVLSAEEFSNLDVERILKTFCLVKIT